MYKRQDSADIPFQTHKYELQENYRNALEITEFVNQTFEMHMLPIGIHGSVSVSYTHLVMNH